MKRRVNCAICLKSGRKKIKSKELKRKNANGRTDLDIIELSVHGSKPHDTSNESVPYNAATESVEDSNAERFLDGDRKRDEMFQHQCKQLQSKVDAYIARIRHHHDTPSKNFTEIQTDIVLYASIFKALERLAADAKGYAIEESDQHLVGQLISAMNNIKSKIEDLTSQAIAHLEKSWFK